METSIFVDISIAGAFMAGLGIVLAAVLAFANKRLYVYEDPRIDDVEALLPSSNCGACGTAGCRPFAEMAVNGEIEPAKCTVNTVEMNQAIAQYLGIGMGDVEKRTARLACAGGSNVARNQAVYQGMDTCRAASMVGSGGKSCVWGCLGLADCEDVCDFDAIFMNKQGLPEVIDDKCTACGDCVDICPKDLFSIQPMSHQLWVACKNQQFGDDAEVDCVVACNACERCVKDAPEGLISVVNNVAQINYELNDLATKLPAERCPTGAIVWLDIKKGAVKGRDAVRIVRREALPLG